MTTTSKSKNIIKTALNHNFSIGENITQMCNYLDALCELKDRVVVIKCGNKHIADYEIMQSICKDAVLLQRCGAKVIIVHGGGPQIGEAIQRMGVLDKFIDGDRFMDSKAFNVAEMVLKGRINADIVTNINISGCKAIGLSGRDGGLIGANKITRTKRDEGSNIERILDLGLMGEPYSLDTEVLEDFLERDFIPVIAPIGLNHAHVPYIINADVLASYIAIKMEADLVFFLADVDGITDEEGNIINTLTSDRAEIMLDDDLILPHLKQKVSSAIMAVKDGVGLAHLINGLNQHSVIIGLLSEDDYGTQVSLKKSSNITPLIA